MTTDFRALCARMADELDHHRQLLTDNRLESHPLSTEARAALAASNQGPTDEELDSMLYYEFTTSTGHGERSDPIGFARAVLTRWGRPAVEPVPVAERPWEREGWCDKEGMCWMGDAEGCGFVPRWRLCKPSDSCLAWSLPHWALPVPQEGADG